MRRSTLALALVLAAAAASAGDPAPPVLGSTAITWEAIQAKASGKGVTQAKQVFRHPTATLDELELHVSTLPPGQSPHPPHKHPDEEVVIVKEGTLEVFLAGETHRVGPGAVIFQAANQMHTVRNVGDTPAVYHVIKWNSPGMLKGRAGN
ncbi:MAG TPA: cupin domain-containing protein [Vicinamibacteria bacterium]|nr:cupin domain-containing protein [Vicinamibacteria bacterium]